MKTGVCYYPEHWPRQRWDIDAQRMKAIGLSHVRMGEFAWSRLEDQQGNLHFDWLSEAIDVLHAQQLKVVLGTPTATPPRWMLDKYPDMLAYDEHGRVRDFGSRRHYCFSHQGYIEECQRIVRLLAQRFGEHPAVVAWQTDNEYGCHSTSISYSPHALRAFQQWCEAKYSSIDELNSQWGNVFWSMEYDAFKQIGLPTGTVTESNPAHRLAYWRFSSDQIQRFNRVQVDIIRQHSPGRDVVHNFMGNFVEFDHHAVCSDLDVATWDNYPLGFLTRDSAVPEDQQRYLRTGHPDGSAFHHDLYRGCCNGRWWVMEQQPGPVNWAPYNPSPLPGMVRLWGWEAFAHGAELMSYFRWRQAPFAQEQTHTGLLLSNSDDDVAAGEVAQLSEELLKLEHDEHAAVNAKVAIVLSYSGIAIQEIQSPGGEAFNPLSFCQRLHSACRQWGLSVDIVSPQADLSAYSLILVCNLSEDDEAFTNRLLAIEKQDNVTIVLFPGTGSRTHDYSIPDVLPPGTFQSLIDVRVVRSESVPPDMPLIASTTTANSTPISCGLWREHIRTPLPAQAIFNDGVGFHYVQGKFQYINALPDQATLLELVSQWAVSCNLTKSDLGPDLRTEQMGRYRVAFNYGAQPAFLPEKLGIAFGISEQTVPIVGNLTLSQAEVAVWVVE